jgi:hypothetical protein
LFNWILSDGAFTSLSHHLLRLRLLQLLLLLLLCCNWCSCNPAFCSPLDTFFQ